MCRTIHTRVRHVKSLAVSRLVRDDDYSAPIAFRTSVSGRRWRGNKDVRKSGRGSRPFSATRRVDRHARRFSAIAINRNVDGRAGPTVLSLEGCPDSWDAGSGWSFLHFDEPVVLLEDVPQPVVWNRRDRPAIGAGHRLSGNERIDDGFFNGFRGRR